MNGAIVACKHEPDPDGRAEILLAAVFPSTNVYWIAADRKKWAA